MKVLRNLLSWLRQHRGRKADKSLQVETVDGGGVMPAAALPSVAAAIGTPAGAAPEVRERPRRRPMQSTLSALYDYLAETYQFRYNTLTDRTEVGMETGEAVRYRIMNKRTLNDIAIDAMNHRFQCWDRDVKRWVESGHIVGYHPFRTYFDHLPVWDGEDRVTPLAQRVSSSELWVMVFHRWMLAMTASWMGGGHAVNSMAPILISTQQGWGKSTFARQLMPTALRPYFTEAYDLNQPTTCVRQLATFGLINLDEFDKIPARKMPQLKTLMQMEELRVRKAYQPQEEALARLASFIGTSNSRSLLTDGSGSRRFLCIELEHPISREPIDHDQLFAQLKQEVERGDRWWLTKDEEAEVQAHNKAYYVQSPVEDAFREMFDVLEPDADDKQPLMSASEIYNALKLSQPEAMRGVKLAAFARKLPEWAELVHTKYGNGYRVRYFRR